MELRAFVLGIKSLLSVTCLQDNGYDMEEDKYPNDRP